MDVADWNRRAWNREVEQGNRWTVPVGAELIRSAREGDWSIVLTPVRPVPREWFPDLAGREVLALASGGGQQAPILAAAGARVTLVDLSEAQLAQDREVARREGLELRIVQADMRDLSPLSDGGFDLIVHPCSNTFVPDVRPVWAECHRVLRPGGALLAGFCNPVHWIFDDAEVQRSGELRVRHRIPYSDLEDGDEAERARRREAGEPLCFGHGLEDLLGGQLDAGFVIAGFYEDRMDGHPLDEFIASTIATRAIRSRDAK